MANLSLGVGGVWKQVQKVSIGVGGVWKTGWDYLTVSVTSLSPRRTTLFPSSASATVSILNDGTWSTTTVGGGTNTGTWLTAGAVADVDVYLSGTGDALDSGTLNTWLNCATTRSWTLTEADVGTLAWNGTMQWRDAVTLAVLDTASVDIQATQDI